MIASTLSELLNNAVKYSTVGSLITIALSENPDELILSVQNYGSVIRMEDRDRIFERFYRGLDHRHAAPGTGVGLSVARRVTEAHGGHIWVTSSADSGTTFHLSLPIGAKAFAVAKG
jgi:two-component system sensor histidine kinase KdpD